MKQEKKCLQCGKFFEKKVNCSKKNWKTTKFCSVVCTNLNFKGKCFNPLNTFKKGHKTWNKDKHPDYVQRENHPMWNGGVKIKASGYVLIRAIDHPNRNKQGYVPEHRLVMEKHLGRYLHPKEVVHHINEIVNDNRLENLQLFKNNGEHISYHCLKKPKLPLLQNS